MTLQDTNELLKKCLSEGDVDFGSVLGFDYYMRRGIGGAWCAYILVDKKHPWYGAEQDFTVIANIDVHGGVTYAGPVHWEKTAKLNVWAIGFDCAHAGDHLPNWVFSFPDETYRDKEYVLRELHHLARQAHNALPLWKRIPSLSNLTRWTFRNWKGKK